MKEKLISIGFGNFVSIDRIISIVTPESAPIKRLIQENRDRGMLIDATCGRRTKAVIIMDSNHVILTGLQADTIKSRINNVESDCRSKEEIIDAE